MSQAPGSPPPNPKRWLKFPSGPRKNLETPPQTPNWWSGWWYIPIMLLILWFWQEQMQQMSIKTIPYSQFKEYLAERRSHRLPNPGRGDYGHHYAKGQGGNSEICRAETKRHGRK